MPIDPTNRLGTGLYPHRLNGLRIDPETFNSLCTVAKEFNITFAEAARTVLAWGLQSREDLCRGDKM